MKAQVGVELIVLTSVIMLLSLLVLGAFIYIRSDVNPSIGSASMYEFYNRIADYRRIAMGGCSNFSAVFEHNFGMEVTISDITVKGEYGVIYIKDVQFLGGEVNGSKLVFNVSCNPNTRMLEVKVSR